MPLLVCCQAPRHPRQVKKGEGQEMLKHKRAQRTGQLAPGPRRAVCARRGPEREAVKVWIWRQEEGSGHREPPNNECSEWNRLPCSTVSPGAGNARAGARRPALMETQKRDCSGESGMRSLACFLPDLRLHGLHGKALLLMSVLGLGRTGAGAVRADAHGSPL